MLHLVYPNYQPPLYLAHLSSPPTLSQFLPFSSSIPIYLIQAKFYAFADQFSLLSYSPSNSSPCSLSQPPAYHSHLLNSITTLSRYPVLLLSPLTSLAIYLGLFLLLIRGVSSPLLFRSHAWSSVLRARHADL